MNETCVGWLSAFEWCEEREANVNVTPGVIWLPLPRGDTTCDQIKFPS